jgi:DNA-binding transcriptional LysR family regulator
LRHGTNDKQIRCRQGRSVEILNPTEPLPNLTVQQLEYVAAVARSPTWADAAAAVGVTPSALSQGLAELERRVGVPLFERRGRRRVLRPGAAEVVAHAERVLAATGDLARWAAASRAGRVGRVRIGMIDAAAVAHFPSVLRAYRRSHPGVQLHLTVAPSAELVAGLARGDVDLAVCVAPRDDPGGLAWTPLLREPLGVYRPESGSDAAVASSPASWGPWVTFPVGSHTRALIAEALRQAGVRFDVVAESHQPEVLREMVRLGMGWTVLPEVQAGTGAARLRRARPEPIVERNLVLGRRVDAPRSPPLDALAAALVSHAASRR